MPHAVAESGQAESAEQYEGTKKIVDGALRLAGATNVSGAFMRRRIPDCCGSWEASGHGRREGVCVCVWGGGGQGWGMDGEAALSKYVGSG